MTDVVIEKETGQELLNAIADLKQQQMTLRAQKKKVSKELRNAEKKKTRLKKKARQLSDKDLVTVLQMRQAQLEESPPDSKPTAKEKAKQSKADAKES